MSVVRKLIETNNVRRARSVAQVIRNRDGMRQVGDICFALVVLREPMDETAWELFSRNELSFVLHLAPAEYFRVGLRTRSRHGARHPCGGCSTASSPCRCARRSGCRSRAPPSRAARKTSPTKALRRAEKALRARAGSSASAKQLRAEIGALRSWFGRRDDARKSIDLPAGEIPFAVLDYQQAGQAQAPITEGEALNTLSLLGNLVRRRGVRFTGDADLVGLAETLQNRVAPERVARRRTGDSVHLSDGRSRRFELFGCARRDVADRVRRADAPRADLRHDLPFNPHIRPIFLGIETSPQVLHGAGVIDYLKRYAPDWLPRLAHCLSAAGGGHPGVLLRLARRHRRHDRH